MPAMHLVSTDLPAPLSPHSAVTLPDGRSRSTWYSAWTAPKCLSSSLTLRSGSVVAGAGATAAMSLCIIEDWLDKSDAAASCGGVGGLTCYEMPLAVQTAAPALLHSVATSTNLSLITVDSMLALLTHIGTRREAGCELPVTPDGGAVVLFTRPAGGVAPARSTVARATASCASR